MRLGGGIVLWPTYTRGARGMSVEYQVHVELNPSYDEILGLTPLVSGAI